MKTIDVGAMVRYRDVEYEVVRKQGSALRLRNNRVPTTHPMREIGVQEHMVILLLHPQQEGTQVDRASMDAMARDSSAETDPSGEETGKETGEETGEETSEQSKSLLDATDPSSVNSDATISSHESAAKSSESDSSVSGNDGGIGEPESTDP